MVHVRLNAKETNPNEYVNFISSLPGFDSPSQEDARQLLRALAAQVKPIMKTHGFTVNSFEEYEFNPVFAGRNWNAGRFHRNGQLEQTSLPTDNSSYVRRNSGARSAPS